ncbi:MAG: hypothetical protein JWO69_356 [Thermoleophilia bacterium]|jgi:hypothetical protein|nr:hypothetical protein [Thermoleophilia bacterium]
MTALTAATWVSWARELPPEAVAGLGAAAAFLTIVAIAAQVSARRIVHELHDVEAELVDPRTGLLPQAAVRVRLGAELAWAATSRTPISVAVLRIRGSRFVHAAHVLRHSMREEEQAFVLRDQHVAVELWGADAQAAATGVARIGDDLARAGHPVVDAGIASAPADGSDVETLLAAARRDLRPVDDVLDRVRAGRARVGARGELRLLANILPWFIAMGVVLLAAWRLLPAAIEASLADDLVGVDLAVALVAAIGLPVAAAFVLAAGWNWGGDAVPRSRPYARAGWRTLGAVALVVAAPLAWGIFLPGAPAPAADGFGATLALAAVMVLVLVQARQLVYVGAPALLVLLVVGAAVTWAGVDVWEMPVVANAGRLLAAAVVGALLAKCIERSSWVVVLALAVAAIDVWSVYADSGVTNQLLGDGGDGAHRVVDYLLLAGPVVGGAPMYELGVTDLAFVALFLAWAADWRVDLRVTTAALVAALWGAFVVAEAVDETLPALPFLSVVMVLLVAVRSVRLRSHATRWGSTNTGV